MNRTPEQLKAITTIGTSLCVDAAAGSGKTSVLVERIVHLIADKQADLDQIVAITFTDNAASEMKERLRRECRKRAPQDDPQAMSFWRDVERRVETARISTIHGFCSRLLRENALALGLDPNFSVLSEQESHLLRLQAAHEGLNALLSDKHTSALAMASEYGLRRARGVLEDLFKNAFHLERMGRDFPFDDPPALCARFLGMAEECRSRQLVDFAQSHATLDVLAQLQTFDGQCEKPQDGREALRHEMIGHLQAITSGNKTAKSIEKHLLSIKEHKVKGHRKSNWKSVEAVENLKRLQDEINESIEAVLDSGGSEEVTAASASLTCDVYSVFRHVEALRRRLKREMYALEFDDLIQLALEALRDHPDVRRRTAGEVRFLLIDEFQDTDSVQYDLAAMLCQEDGGPELFIVGDAKQSIYFFRGAEVEVFTKARREAQQLVQLSTNFRTLPDVIAFINDFFSRSDLLKAVETPYVPMSAHREPCSASRVEFLLPPKIESASTGDYRSIEADMIAGRIAQMCSGGVDAATVYDVATQEVRQAGYGDVAILFRSLNDVYLYESRLREWGIPYTLIAGAGFYMRQEIVDMRNLLALIADPWDEVALLGYLRSPMVGLSDEALVRLTRESNLVTAFHSGKAAAESTDCEVLERARNMLDALRARAELPLPELVRFAIDLTGYEAILLAQFLGVQKASNVRKLLELAYGFAGERAPRLRDFVRYLDDVTAREVREGEANLSCENTGSVSIMTVHKAKGLEFPIVFLADLARSTRHSDASPVAVDRDLGMVAKVTDAKGKLVGPPLQAYVTRRKAERELEEEARILYVAMTRARDWLILCGAPVFKKTCSFSSFTRWYGLLEASDGDVIEGDGWTATVRRAVPASAKRVEPPHASSAAVPRDIDRRMAPIETPGSSPASLSTSRLLDLIQKESGGVPTYGKAELPKKGAGIDPALRGDMLHLMFQRWDFKSPVKELASAVCRELCPSIRRRSSVVQDLVRTGENFLQTPLGRELAGQERLAREVPFCLRVSDLLLTGTIDAVLEDGTIIDYKTGARTGKTLERYVMQVQLYAAAHQRLRSALPPRAYLVYVDAGDTVEVDVSSQAIERALARAGEAVTARCSARYVLT